MSRLDARYMDLDGVTMEALGSSLRQVPGTDGGSSLPDSHLNADLHEFYLDGQNQLTNSIVYQLDVLFDSTLKALFLNMQYPRTSGTLLLEILRDGSPVVGASLLIDATNPQKNSLNTLSETFLAGSIFSVRVTTSSFLPLANKGEFYTLLK